MSALSVSILAVRGIPWQPSTDRFYSVRVRHGQQEKRTRPVGHRHHHHNQHHHRKKQDDAATDDEESTALKGEDFEIEDTEDYDDTVDIALVYEAKTSTPEEDESICHSTATIAMSMFRLQPDKTTKLWLPLQATAPHVDDAFAAIRIAVTYHYEDCGAQGYIFALFCGLVPLSWIEKFAFLPREGDSDKCGTKESTYRPWYCNKAFMIKEPKRPPSVT
ncbi:unnamed protein product [Pylaiella littoralis]